MKKPLMVKTSLDAEDDDARSAARAAGQAIAFAHGQYQHLLELKGGHLNG